MAIQVSTGLRNQMLDTGSLKNALDNGFIHIYSGSPPATADAAATGTLLLTLTESGDGSTGLTFEASAANGVISKATAEDWQGTVSTSGLAAWYRHVGSADTGVSSTTEPRIQGTIAAAGADMNMTDPNLVATSVETVNSYNVALPTY